MKKLLAVLWLLLVLGVTWAIAEDNSFTSGDYQYVLLEDGTAEITRYMGREETREIPGQLDGYAVTSIGRSAFSRRAFLTSITIPDSVTVIGECAFSGCSSLSSITIPRSVASIGDSAFLSCSSLSHVTILEGVTVIEAGAFSNCSSLISITIPGSITSIGMWAFDYCPLLTLAVVPGSYAEQFALDNSIPCMYTPQSWACSCGAFNNTNFCPDCGTASPALDPECVNCGYKPESKTPNFCPECGTKF